MVLWRPTRPSRTNNQKRCPFHCWGLEYKSRRSRNTCNNRQIWSWSTEWCTAKANRVVPREHTGHSKCPLPTTQEKNLHMEITGWPIPKADWLCFCSQRWKSSISLVQFSLGQFSSVTQSCLILCDPMNSSMPGLPVTSTRFFWWLLLRTSSDHAMNHKSRSSHNTGYW